MQRDAGVAADRDVLGDYNSSPYTSYRRAKKVYSILQRSKKQVKHILKWK